MWYDKLYCIVMYDKLYFRRAVYCFHFFTSLVLTGVKVDLQIVLQNFFIYHVKPLYVCGRDTCNVPSKTYLQIQKHEVKLIYTRTTSDKTGCYLYDDDISGVWMWTGLKWFRTGYKFRLLKHSPKEGNEFLDQQRNYQLLKKFVI